MERTPDEQNWFKAAIALKYTRDSLAESVAPLLQKRHHDILEELGVNPGSKRTCSECTLSNLLPDHSRQNCTFKRGLNRGRCFCETGLRKCPKNICSRFYDLIILDHSDRRPNWSNTDPSRWCSDYWEYAKCFIRMSGFSGVRSAEECDLIGLLQIIANCHGMAFGSRTRWMLERCMFVRNKIMHSAALAVTDMQLEEYVAVMAHVLLRTGNTLHFQAIRKLEELIECDYVSSDFNDKLSDMKDKALAETKRIRKKAVEALRFKTTEIFLKEMKKDKATKREDETTTFAHAKLEKDEDELAEIGHRLIQQANKMGSQTDMEDLQFVLKLLDDLIDIEIHSLDVEITQGEDSDANIREISRLFRDVLKKRLLETDEEFFEIDNKGYLSQKGSEKETEDSGLEEEVASREMEYCGELPLNVDKSKLPSEEGLIVGFDCKRLFPTEELQDTDDTKSSERFADGDLLHSTDLSKLCSTEGRTSTNLKKECDKICTFIKDKSHEIVHVWAAYKPDDETNIRFVVFAKKEICLDLKPWPLEIRTVNTYSDESKTAMYSEENCPLSLETSRKIGDVIDKYSVKLMGSHTYLSAISASSVISKNYGSSDYTIKHEPCIVLSVLLKNFIPINEETFPPRLDEIPVDVREGGVQSCKGFAEDYHRNVRMGCKITSSVFPQIYATLGGFVEHPEYGLCGITCAHFVRKERDFMDLKEQGNIKEKSSCTIFQPVYDPPNKIGTLVETSYKEAIKIGKPGVDLALFKIDKRPPTDGNFPSYDGQDLRIVYNSGNVWGKAGIPSTQRQVMKFGFRTGLTFGEIQFDNLAVKELNVCYNTEVCGTMFTSMLYKQYLIKSSDANIPFSDLGDSGALVFVEDRLENDLRCIGMVVGQMNDNTCVVTPITAILEELKVTKLKSFIQNITWSQIDRRLTEMEAHIMDAISRIGSNEATSQQRNNRSEVFIVNMEP